MNAGKASREILAARWKELISEFFPGRQTVNAYCAARGVSVNSYYYW
jgi:hypothetical protein